MRISDWSSDVCSSDLGLMTRRQHQILARFLAEPIPFEGCISVDDFRKILRSYDVNSEYPEGSGLSYTRFFLPKAYQAGFRLTNYSEEIWDALLNALGSYAGADRKSTRLNSSH